MTRAEAEGWLARMLMDKVRDDRYPSATQLALIEEVIPRPMVPDYLEILIEKAGQDGMPSVPLLRRIQRLARSLPLEEPQRG